MASLVSELKVFSGAFDISETVFSFKFGNGLNVISNPETYNRIIGNGEIRLRNNDNRWVDTSLEELDELRITLRGMDVRCKVTSFERNIAQAFVSLTLGPIIDHSSRIAFRLTSDSKEPKVLEAADLTITPQTPWVGYTASNGLDLDTNVSAFLNNFAVYADAFIYETSLGALEAFIPATENRGNVRTISAASDNMILRTAVSRHRRGWRRNTQVWHRLDRELVTFSTTYPDDGDVRNSNTRLVSDSGGVKTFEINLDPLAAMQISQDEFGGFSHFTWEDDTYIIDRKSGSNTGVSRNQTVREGRTPGQGGRPTVYVTVEIRSSQSASALIDDMEFEDDFKVYGHWLAAPAEDGSISHTRTARVELRNDDDEAIALPTTIIGMEDSVRPLIQKKLDRLKTWTPRMERLTFPLIGQEYLLDLEVGELVRLDINEPELDIYGDYYIAHIQRDIQAHRMPLITMEFLELRELTRSALPDGAELWRGLPQTWRGEIETWITSGSPGPDPDPDPEPTPGTEPPGLVGWFKGLRNVDGTNSTFWSGRGASAIGSGSADFTAAGHTVELDLLLWDFEDDDADRPQLNFVEDARAFMTAILGKSAYIVYNSNQVKEAAISTFSMPGSRFPYLWESSAWGNRPTITSRPFGFVIANSGQANAVRDFINLE